MHPKSKDFDCRKLFQDSAGYKELIRNLLWLYKLMDFIDKITSSDRITNNHSPSNAHNFSRKLKFMMIILANTMDPTACFMQTL